MCKSGGTKQAGKEAKSRLERSVHKLVFNWRRQGGEKPNEYTLRRKLVFVKQGGEGIYPEKPPETFGLFFRTLSTFASIMKPAVDSDVLNREDTEVLLSSPYHLVVWNDDVNTFEWVIETLMDVCGHTYEQAEQCSYIIHFNGKYAVKNGDYEDLRPMCDAILDRGINATLEVTA